jgi:hypothetical protein
MNQGFTPDRPSFERILWAAFMIQQMNTQLLNDPTREDEKTQELSGLAHIQPAPEALDLEAVVNQAELALALHTINTITPSLIETLYEKEQDADSPLSEFSRLLTDIESVTGIVGASEQTSLGTIRSDRCVDVPPPEDVGRLDSKQLYLGPTSTPESSVTPPIEAAKTSDRNIPTFSIGKFKWNLANLYSAAAPVAVLVTIAVFLFLTIMDGNRSEASVEASESGSSKELLPHNCGIAASEPSQSLRQRVSTVSAATLTHKRVTDPVMSEALDALSRYEIAGLRRQALYGDDSAALLLGLAYETGHLVPQSCAKAADWVARSASQGNAAAQYNLGLRYRDGDGVPIDEHYAATWLTKAVAQRYPEPLAISKPAR